MSDSRDEPGRPERSGAGARDADTGLFGPESVTWRLHSEPLMGVATLRALLLQGLHPVVTAALEQHSAALDVWHRLSRLAEYVAVTTFGSATEAMFAASRVRASHARVRGVLRSGVEYSADDPQLLAWVHCCLVASFLEVLTRSGAALTGSDQDRYVSEQVRAGMLVGLEPDEVPHDRAGLQDYFRVIKPALECLPSARRVAQEVAGCTAADGTKPVWAGVAGLAFAALPPWGRRLYALRELPGAAALNDAATTVGLRSLRTALRGAQTPGAQAGEKAPDLRVVRAPLEP